METAAGPDGSPSPRGPAERTTKTKTNTEEEGSFEMFDVLRRWYAGDVAAGEEDRRRRWRPPPGVAWRGRWRSGERTTMW